MAEVRKHRPRSFSSKAPAPIVNIAERRSKREALEPGRKPSIFVAVPTEDGWVHFTHPLMFGRAIGSNAVPECPFQFVVHVEPGKKGPDYARNCIVQTFLQNSDCDWLMMIDDDQGVPDNFWQLCLVADADIVAGITYVWVGHMDPEAMLRVNNYNIDGEGQCFNLPAPGDEVKQPYRVPIVGTGCIAIRRRVFAPKPHGLGHAPFYFTHDENRKVRAGEDINFSVDANRAGFTLAVHPGVIFDHVKEMSLAQVRGYAEAWHGMKVAGKQTTDQQRLSIG